MDREQLRKLPLVYYAAGAYWPDMQTKLELITRLDYQADLALLVRLAGHLSLGDLQEKPLLVSELKDKIVTLKTFPAGHPRAGQVATAAADDVLSVGSAVCQHALGKGVIFFNPFASVPRLHRPRSRGNGDGGTYALVKESEIKSPLTVVEVGVGMRGCGAQLWQRRLIPVLIALGLRPEDICAMRHIWWRDDRGAKKMIEIDDAVKNVAGHLFTGEPKTGSRELHLFAFVAQLLERLYQAQGQPGLAALAFPGVQGGLLQWGNWVSNVWYPALYRSGCWAYTQDRMRQLHANGELWFGRDGNGVPRLKRFLKDARVELTPETIWPATVTGTTRQAKRHILALFPHHTVFDTPKPEPLLGRIIEIASDPGDLVLDAYLGCGTTAAAAHKLGRIWVGIENGGHAATHCAERLRRVVDGESGGISTAVQWRGGGGFRFLRIKGAEEIDAVDRFAEAPRLAL